MYTHRSIGILKTPVSAWMLFALLLTQIAQIEGHRGVKGTVIISVVTIVIVILLVTAVVLVCCRNWCKQKLSGRFRGDKKARGRESTRPLNPPIYRVDQNYPRSTDPTNQLSRQMSSDSFEGINVV